MNKYKIGIVIPHISKERKPLLDFVLQRMKEQTMFIDYICLLDYPKPDGVSHDIPQRYKKGIKECFANKCDLVFLIEDDDYYPINYIEQIYKQWLVKGCPNIIGLNRTIYYHIFNGTYQEIPTLKHSSAFCTAIGRQANYTSPNDFDRFYDIQLWRSNKGSLVTIDNFPVGIKHGLGLCGGAGHTKTLSNTDNEDYAYLKSKVDEKAFDFYMKFISPADLTEEEWEVLDKKVGIIRIPKEQSKPIVREIPKEQPKEIEPPKPQGYNNGRVIWSLDSSYAGVSFIADYLNAKVIMYNRRREDFDKMFYDFITYVDNKEQTLEYLTNAKELLLFGAKGVQYLLPILDKLNKKLADYKVTMLITDHWYFKDKYLNGDRINKELKQCKDVKYLFMPDCVKFKADFIKDYSLYYQYLPVPEIKKTKQLKVSHSAGLKVESDEKGTSIIRTLCKELNLKLDVLSGLAWNKCVEKKAEAMIFIDQIISNERAKQMKIDGYGGGIGKSGLEAMKLGAVVLTSGELVGDNKLPKAPVILVNEKNAKNKLQEIINLPKKELLAIGKKNKEWADKYTGFDFVLNNIDDKVQRCSCIAVSNTLKTFKIRMQEKYNLAKYNKNQPTLFFGMYLEEDYEKLKNHKAKAVILFGGTDVDYFGKVYKGIYLEFIIKHRIIAISENVKMRLLDYGLESEFIPICPAPIKKNPLPKDKADCIYFYGKGRSYGEEIMQEVERLTPFDVIKTTKKTYSPSELQKIYKKCFIGLRLTPKDGLSNTVIELGLAGRRVVYNCNPLPNALKWNSVEDIVRLVNEEYKHRKYDCSNIVDEMYDYMKYKDFWLFT